MSKHTVVTAITVIVILCLIAEKSQAKPKKGCEAFGHACYGGHGKRSVASIVSLENMQMHPATITQVLSNDGKALEQYRRNRVINFLKQLIDGGRRSSDLTTNGRLNDNGMQYPISGEILKENPGLN